MLIKEGFCSASSEIFRRFADPPIGSELLEIASTSYRFISKFVTAFSPRNLIAAMSYASAASDSVAALLGKQNKITYTFKLALPKICNLRFVYSKER